MLLACDLELVMVITAVAEMPEGIPGRAIPGLLTKALNALPN